MYSPGLPHPCKITTADILVFLLLSSPSRSVRSECGCIFNSPPPSNLSCTCFLVKKRGGDGWLRLSRKALWRRQGLARFVREGWKGWGSQGAFRMGHFSHPGLTSGAGGGVCLLYLKRQGPSYGGSISLLSPSLCLSLPLPSSH